MSVLVKRDSARNAIKRILTASKKAELYDEATLESYFVLLNEQWTKFCLAQDAVEISCGSDLLEAEDAEREQGEEWYRESVANFTRAANAFKASHKSKPNDAQSQSRADVKLPKVDLPHFSGDAKEWRPFRDAFTSFIHNEAKVSGALKLHYLRCSLQGEALNVVKAFPVTDDNYLEAWNLLKKRYDVERVIVDSHFRALFNIPKLNTESSVSLKALIDNTQEHYQSLKAIGRPVTNWDDWLVHLTISKLDFETHKQWELAQTKDEIADFNTLIAFLEKRCRSLEAIISHQQHVTFNSKGRQPKNRKPSALHSATTNKLQGKRYHDHVCAFCSGKHLIYICEKFRSAAVSTRISFVNANSLCFNCLSNGHDCTNCPSNFTCRVCNVRHHTLLHREYQINDSSQASTSNAPKVNHAPSYSTHTKHLVLLGTAMVQVMDKFKKLLPCRLLFDNGSHVSFVTENCVQRLQLKRTPATTAIEGIGATSAGSSKGEVQLNLSSIDGTFATTINAHILKKITSNLPSAQVRQFNWPHIEGLVLADPFFHTPAAVDILLGSDELGQFLCSGLIKGPAGTPIAQRSTLGWILMGKVPGLSTTYACTTSPSLCLHTDAALTEAITKFWEVEALPAVKHLSTEEKLCEQHFEDTYYRQRDGRFVVQLPFKPDCSLGNSRNSAVRSLLRMEKLFAKDEQLYLQYKDFIHEFIALGHMEEANQPPLQGMHYYMPHRAVIKDTSTTTKLRVVFNASCRSTTGFSLNDTLMIGPQLQPDLFTTLLRLRTHRFAMSADIAKMYRQVRVNRKHVDFQRIVWRDSPTEDIKDYRLLTVTYGVASASHLAVKCLQKASMQCNENSLAAQVILRDFYMDDLLTGCYEEADLQRLQIDVSSTLNQYGFHLRKWASNSKVVINSIPEDQREIIQSLNFDETDSVRALGLQWDPLSDHLAFTLQEHEISKTNLTKRLILSDTSKLFDPLGLLSPSTIIPKMLFQQLWRPKVDWDETVPHDVKRKWLHYRDHITYFAAIKVPRWVGTGIPNAVSDLHGFADASQSAYAAVVYVRTVAPNGKISVCLLTAKTRVAPLKATTLTLPRLELCGAALLAQLIKHVQSSFTPHIRSVYGWTDSSVALAWIRKPPGKWSTFVGNRVSLIQKVIPPESWMHVQSAQNPADCATRGVLPQHLANHPLWWTGPKWLQQDESTWPVQYIYSTNIDQRAEPSNLVNSPEFPLIWDLIEQYSSLRKLRNVTAYILRFVNKCRQHTSVYKNGKSALQLTNEQLSFRELNDAFNLWIRLTQRQFYSDEVGRLESNQPVGQNSKLLKLHPFLDEHGLIRVGGRLRHSSFPSEVKYPLVLPGRARLTMLICDDIHFSTLHAGPQTMLVVLQSRFWIIGARNILRKVYGSCVKCKRYSNVLQQQLMGDLPRSRVEACRPFLRSGVDFAGPVHLRLSKGRGTKSVKGYISIFICMVTGAMHLELASDLSSSTFIAVFKRFVSRRGHCRELYSDNGTNFVGAEKELQRLLTLAIRDEQLAKYLADDGTVWHFNPPASPHMGGYWETAVKRVKFHLRRTVGSTLLTFEEFTTLLAEIEACVNSRPLCAISSDVNDLSTLTPGHYLIGEPLKALPEPSIAEFKGNLVSRWQLISRLRQHFWQRWSSEFLLMQQQRSKWNRSTHNFKVNDLVLIREEKLPPAKWKLGRIIIIHPGDDGKVRVVTLKTVDGVLKRPIVKIAPLLPAEDDTLN